MPFQNETGASRLDSASKEMDLPLFLGDFRLGFTLVALQLGGDECAFLSSSERMLASDAVGLALLLIPLPFLFSSIALCVLRYQNEYTHTSVIDVDMRVFVCGDR